MHGALCLRGGVAGRLLRIACCLLGLACRIGCGVVDVLLGAAAVAVAGNDVSRGIDVVRRRGARRLERAGLSDGLLRLDVLVGRVHGVADKVSRLPRQLGERVLGLLCVGLALSGGAVGNVAGRVAGVSGRILCLGRLVLGAAQEALCSLLRVR